MGAGEEGSPLLPKQEESVKEENIPKQEEGAGWTVDGLPLGHGNVVGAPVSRSQWDSPLFACLGRNDEFCSSDLEVCKFEFISYNLGFNIAGIQSIAPNFMIISLFIDLLFIRMALFTNFLEMCVNLVSRSARKTRVYCTDLEI